MDPSVYWRVLIRVINPAFPEEHNASDTISNLWASLFDYFVAQSNINGGLRVG
jgi:Na+-transporting NADH:ubiquinone oxidoreductase subunit NqrB